MGNAVATSDLSGYLQDNLDVIPPVIASSAVVAVFMASLTLAISIHTARRAFATGAVIAAFVILTAMGGIFVNTLSGSAQQYSLLISPLGMLEGMVYWVFGVAPSADSDIALADLPGGYYLVAIVVYSGLALLDLLPAPPEDERLMAEAPARNAAPISVQSVSRWYGNVVAVNEITFSLEAGITGLLGPNGAGKSTLLHMLAGLLQPSSGTANVLGEPAWQNPDIYRHVGFVPEREAVYPFLSGLEFVRMSARLHGLDDVNGASMRAIEAVEMVDAKDRATGGYSKGMKQRIKIAAAIVHRAIDPAPGRAVQRRRPSPATAHDGHAAPTWPTTAPRSCSHRISSKRSSGWRRTCWSSSRAGSRLRATFMPSAA